MLRARPLGQMVLGINIFLAFDKMVVIALKFDRTVERTLCSVF